MREKDHYELEFVRYLLNTHNDNICCLASVSCKYSNVLRISIVVGQATKVYGGGVGVDSSVKCYNTRQFAMTFLNFTNTLL